MWITIDRGEWHSGVPLEESQVAIARDGTLTFCAELLKSVGIDQFATLVADPDTLRIGVHKPKEHELARAVRVHVVKNSKGKDSGRRSVRATRAFRALCLEPLACAGRHELTIKDHLLIVNLAGIEFDKGEAAQERPAR